ncbi:MAG: RNA-directed DNA polymerase, partial [Nanoarchaeota archaeon]
SDILWLLGQVIDSFYAERKGVGLPLGNLTSQLLVNIYMNEFDTFAKHTLKLKYYVRYADDFLALHHNRKYLIELIPRIQDFLEKELKLHLHPQKIFIKTFASGVDFLGWVHFPHHRVLRTATKRRMLKKIKDYPTDEIIASYEGLLRHGNAGLLSQEIKKLSRESLIILL